VLFFCDDRDLTRTDIQGLSSAGAVAAFFLKLGYNIDGRIGRTPQRLLRAEYLAAG